ncbi:hypothetical protein GN956_G10726 [Arapaima gigas]
MSRGPGRSGSAPGSGGSNPHRLLGWKRMTEGRESPAHVNGTGSPQTHLHSHPHLHPSPPAPWPSSGSSGREGDYGR